MNTDNHKTWHQRLVALSDAIQLFHSGGPWDEDKKARWKGLTGTDEATTKTLCDYARALPLSHLGLGDAS